MNRTRTLFVLAAVAALSACAPQIPDSARGVGFDNSIEAQRQRDAALAAGGNRPFVVSETVLPPSVTVAPDPIAAETQQVLAATRPTAQAAPMSEAAAANSGVEPIQASPSNPAPVLVTNSTTGLSAENNFDLVAEQRSIESDAALIARNRAQYEVVQPQALPSRPADTGPNIVTYALQTNTPIGQRVFQRSAFNSQSKFERNCAKYASADLAQLDFLSRGGPERDRMGLDPDGDGYACSWDPRPFRKAAQG